MNSTTFNFDLDHYINRFIPRFRLHLLPRPISWLLGYRSTPRPPVRRIFACFWSCIGAIASIAIIETVFHSEAIRSHGTPIIITSFGAAAILEFNALDSPLAQPRNMILGHAFSTVIGISITKLFQLSSNFEELRWVAGALSVGVSSAFMGLTNTVHPPAGATALAAATTPEVTEIGWFLLPVVLLGSTLMLATACLVNNIQRTFPRYWWTPMDLNRQFPTDSGKAPKYEKNDRVVVEPGGRSSHVEKLEEERYQILITREHLLVPEWLPITEAERAMLKDLGSKLLQEPLKATSTRDGGTDLC